MIIDIIALVILLISAGIAFMRGLIREVLTIAGVVGGLAAAYFGAPLLIPYMLGWFGVEEGVEPERLFGVLPYDIVATALSYGLIFIVVVVVLSLISHSLAEWAKSNGLGAIDRSFGFLFGLLRGILLLGVLYMPVHLFVNDETKKSWFANSRAHFYIDKVSTAMSFYIPKNAEEQLQEAATQGEKIIDAREKLQQIDLLKKDDVESDPNASSSTPTSTPNGYNEEFRDGMDQLFDQTTRTPNE